MACWFDKKRKKADKPRMLELLHQLNARIEKLNDGPPPPSRIARGGRGPSVRLRPVPKRRPRYEAIVL